MSAEIECIEVPVKHLAYQFVGFLEPQNTPSFVVKYFDPKSLKFCEYKGYETHPEGKDHYYTIVNKRTGATEKIHEGDWFVKYYHKAVIVSDEEFIMKYIQLTENFRLMNGTVLI